MAMAAAAAAIATAAQEIQLGMTKYCEDQWADAVLAFDRALALDSTKSHVYEYKVRCHIHLSKAEAAEYAGTGRGPDGSANSKLAYDTAWRVVQKFGTTRWESLWVLAEAACHVRQYGIVAYIFTQITEHPTYTKATPKQKETVDSHAKRHAGRGTHSCRYRSTVRFEGVAAGGTTPAGDYDPFLISGAAVRVSDQRVAVSIDHAFSPDTLLRVVDLAKDDDPNVAIRMSGVCRRWRGILVNQPGCWQRLTLGNGEHMMEKARTFLQRCRGADVEMQRGLKELYIAHGFQSAWVEELGELLAPHAPYIRHVASSISPGDARIIFSYLHHGLKSARVLVIQYGATASLDYGLLPTDESQLKELSLSHISHDNPRDRQDEIAYLANGMTTWVEAPDRQLAELVHLRISDSYFTSPISNLYGILQNTPKLRCLHLDNLTWWVPPTGHFFNDAVLSQPMTRLESLRLWSMDCGKHPTLPVGYNPFRSIAVPNLVHLELMGVWSPGHICLSEGLTEALPSLRSLILGKTAIPDDFIDTLRSTSALEFLCLTNCNLSPEFLDRFSTEATTAPHLLPNLVALSLAGNIHVRTRYLREFLNGRAADAVPPPPGQVQSADNADETVGDIGPPEVGPDDDMSPDPADPVTPDRAEVMSTAYTEVVPTPIARLRWLNIDHCTTVDARYFPKFQEKVRFVSHWMGAPDEDRIRGKGKWDWEKIEKEVKVDEEELEREREKKEKRAGKGKRYGWYGEKYEGP